MQDYVQGREVNLVHFAEQGLEGILQDTPSAKQ